MVFSRREFGDVTNMLLESNWKPIISKFQEKLSNWKASTLSFGGRLTLIKAQQGVLDALEKLRRMLLWGSKDEKRKLYWVDWTKEVVDKKRW
uniref:Reverse transcriptase zinc-binding domain-containing protein n=1 Tax=Lactuca sativa TaxID=4236 RepID=A0A9R1UED9_LACSA|nr:hypothetical protein LSAT_V11C900469600 [Lactuca sativa]